MASTSGVYAACSRMLSAMVQFSHGSLNLGIVLIRVVLGLMLVAHAWGYIAGEAGVPNLIAGSDLSSGFFTWWGDNLLMKYPGTMSALIVWLEFLSGIAFVSGGLVRPLGTLLAFLMLCFALSSARPLERELVILVGTCALGCATSGAGRLFGLDAIFDQHFPRWLTWARSRAA